MKNLWLLLLCLVVISCKKNTENNTPPDPEVAIDAKLKDLSGFPVGMQYYIGILDFPVPKSRVAESFDRYTSTAFFWNSTEPSPNTYTYTDADKALAFVTDANMKLHAHALIYFQDGIMPDYLKNFSGTKAAFELMVKNHIQTIVSRYKGKVAGYDVVNEMVDDYNGTKYFNDLLSRYYFNDAEYEDFIGKCFRWANEADPDAKLFYNEAKLERADKKRLRATVTLVNNLKNAGVPIHGVGTQTHTDIYMPVTIIDTIFKELSATGLLVHVSEMDISVNEDAYNGRNYTYTSLSSDLSLKQKEAYKNIVYSYRKNVPDAQKWGITLWDLMDHTSWLLQYPQEWPCLYNQNCDKKDAYYGFGVGLIKK